MVGSVSPMLSTSQPTLQCFQLRIESQSCLPLHSLCVYVCECVCTCVYTRHVWVPNEKEMPHFLNMCTV